MYVDRTGLWTEDVHTVQLASESNSLINFGYSASVTVEIVIYLPVVFARHFRIIVHILRFYKGLFFRLQELPTRVVIDFLWLSVIIKIKKGCGIMLSNQFQVNLPSEFMPFLSLVKDGKTTDEKVVLSLAIGMFLSKQATLAKAAELAQKSIWEFVDVLKGQGIPWGEYTEDSLLMDELSLSKLAVEK